MVTLLGFALFIAAFLNTRIEYALFVTAASVIAALFCAGAVHILHPFSMALFVGGLVLGSMALYRIVVRRDRSVLTPGLALFILCGIGHFLLTRYSSFSSWDEFSHWGTVIKHITGTASLYRNQVLYFADYPPGVALFVYFIQTPFGFSETGAYFATGLLVLAAAAVLTVNVPWRNAYVAVLIYAIIYFCAYIFGRGISTVLIDYILGSFFGATIALYWLQSRENSTKAIILCLPAIFSLVLLKAAGLGLALVVAVLIVADRMLVAYELSIKHTVRSTLITLAPLATALIAQGAWQAIGRLAHYPSRTVGFDAFFPFRLMLDRTLDSARANILEDFVAALMGAKPAVFETQITLPLAMAAITSIYVAALIAARSKGAGARTAAAIAIVMIGFAVYLYGLLTTYLTNMSMFEAQQIGYFDRFVSVYLAGLVLFGVGLLRENLGHWLSTTALALVLYVCIAIAPQKSRDNLVVEPVPANPPRLDVITKVRPMLAKVPETARVYVVWPESNGYEYWMTRFELIPRGVNRTCWAVALEPRSGDMYTCRKSVEQWRNELSSYDYVLIGRRDDQLGRQYSELFASSLSEMDHALFKVTTINGRLSLALVP